MANTWDVRDADLCDGCDSRVCHCEELADRLDRIYGDDSPLAASTFGFLSEDE